MSKVVDVLKRTPVGFNRLIGDYEPTIRLLYRILFVVVVYNGFQWVGSSIPPAVDSAGIESELRDISKSLDGIALEMPLR